MKDRSITRLEDLAPDAMVRIRQFVPSVVPVHPATWWRWVAAGLAPAPVPLSRRVTAWKVSDIRAFLESRAAANEGASQADTSVPAATNPPATPKSPKRSKFVEGAATVAQAEQE